MTGPELLEAGDNLQAPQGANFRMADLPADVEVVPVDLVAADGAPSKGLFYKRRGAAPRVGVHLMHPRTDQSQNYCVIPLAQAGFGVLARAGRWPNNDAATVHELLTLDVAAGIRFLHRQGCNRVALLGNSGGATLATFYQWQARTDPPGRLTSTPAGDALDLNGFELPAADAIVAIASHVGEGLLLGRMIDPAVVDEDDPLATDPQLDLYEPGNGFRKPPESSQFSDEFLERYRVAQLDRVRRLDAKAMSFITRQRQAAELAVHSAAPAHLERAARMGWFMVIYRTTADPAAVDLHIDPDDRHVQSYTGNRPDLENYGENGFARYVTPRAWLSTWSALSSRARTADNLASIPDPTLLVHYAGDAGCRISDVKNMYSASAASDKELLIVRNADHYGIGLHPELTRGQRTSAGTSKAVQWLSERFPT
jgi:hypothetical protein